MPVDRLNHFTNVTNDVERTAAFFNDCEDRLATILLSELAVFTSATIVAAVVGRLFILFGLAANTQAHTRHSLAAGGGNGGVTLFAVHQTFAPWQLIARAGHGVFNRRIDLILHRPVFGKAASHITATL